MKPSVDHLINYSAASFAATSRFKVTALPINPSQPLVTVNSTELKPHDIGKHKGPFVAKDVHQHVVKTFKSFVKPLLGLRGAFNPYSDQDAEIKSNAHPDVIRYEEAHMPRFHDVIDEYEAISQAIQRATSKKNSVPNAIIKALDALWDSGEVGPKGLARLLVPLKKAGLTKAQKDILKQEIVEDVLSVMKGYQTLPKESWDVHKEAHDIFKIVSQTNHVKFSAAAFYYSGLKDYYKDQLGDGANTVNAISYLHASLSGFMLQSHSGIMALLYEPNPMLDEFRQVIVKELRPILKDEALKEQFFERLYCFISQDTASASKEGYLSHNMIKKNREQLNILKQLLTVEALENPREMVDNLKKISTPEEFKLLFTRHVSMSVKHTEVENVDEKMSELYDEAITLLTRNENGTINLSKKEELESLMRLSYLREDERYMSGFASALANSRKGQLPPNAKDVATAIKFELLLTRYAKLNQSKDEKVINLVTYSNDNSFAKTDTLFNAQEVNALWDLNDKALLPAMYKTLHKKDITASGNEVNLINPIYRSGYFNRAIANIEPEGMTQETENTIKEFLPNEPNDSAHVRRIKWMLRLDRFWNRFGFRPSNIGMKVFNINQEEYAQINVKEYSEGALLPKKLERYLRFKQLCQEIPAVELLQNPEEETYINAAYSQASNVPYQAIVKARIKKDPYIPHQTPPWLVALLTCDMVASVIQMFMTANLALSHSSLKPAILTSSLLFNAAMLFYGSDAILYEKYILKSGLARGHSSIISPERDQMKKGAKAYLYNAFPGIFTPIERLINARNIDGREHKLMAAVGSVDSVIPNLALFHDLEEMETRGKYINREILRPLFGLEMDKPTEQFSPYENAETNDVNLEAMGLNLASLDINVPIEESILKVYQKEKNGFAPRNQITAGLYMNLHWLLSKDPKYPNGTIVIKKALEKFMKDMPELNLFDNPEKNNFIAAHLKHNMKAIARGTGLKDFIVGQPFEEFLSQQLQEDLVGTNKLSQEEFELFLKALMDNRDDLIKDAFVGFGNQATTKKKSYKEKDVLAHKKGIDPMFSRAMAYELIHEVRDKQVAQETISISGQHLLGGMSLESLGADQLEKTVKAMHSLYNIAPENAKEILKSLHSNASKILAVGQEAAQHYEIATMGTMASSIIFPQYNECKDTLAELFNNPKDEILRFKDTVTKKQIDNLKKTGIPKDLIGLLTDAFSGKIREEGLRHLCNLEEFSYLREAEKKKGAGDSNENLHITKTFLEWEKTREGIRNYINKNTDNKDRFIAAPSWSLLKDTAPSSYLRLIMSQMGITDELLKEKMKANHNDIEKALADIEFLIVRKMITDGQSGEALEKLNKKIDERLGNKISNEAYQKLMDLMPQQSDYLLPFTPLPGVAAAIAMLDPIADSSRLRLLRASTSESMAYGVLQNIEGLNNLHIGLVANLSTELNKIAAEYHLTADDKFKLMTGEDVKGIKLENPQHLLYDQLKYQIAYQHKEKLEKALVKAAETFLETIPHTIEYTKNDIFCMATQSAGVIMDIYYAKLRSSDGASDALLQQILTDHDAVKDLKDLFSLKLPNHAFDKIIYKHKVGNLPMTSLHIIDALKIKGFLDQDNRLINFKAGQSLGDLGADFPPHLVQRIEEALLGYTLPVFNAINANNQPDPQNQYYDAEQHFKKTEDRLKTEFASIASLLQTEIRKTLKDYNDDIDKKEKELAALKEKNPTTPYSTKELEEKKMIRDRVADLENMKESVEQLVAYILQSANAGISDKYAGKIKNTSSIYTYDQLKDVIYESLFGIRPTVKMNGVVAIYRDPQAEILTNVKKDIQKHEANLVKHRKKMAELQKDKKTNSADYNQAELALREEELDLMEKAAHQRRFLQLIFNLGHQRDFIKRHLGKDAFGPLKHSMDDVFSAIDLKGKLKEDITIKICGIPVESQDMFQGKVPTELINPLSDRVWAFLSKQKELTPEVHTALGEQLEKWLILDPKDKDSGLLAAGMNVLERGFKDNGYINTLMDAKKRGVFTKVSGVDSVASQQIRQEIIRENPIYVDIYTAANLRTDSQGSKGREDNNLAFGSNYFNEQGFFTKDLIFKSILEKMGIHWGPGEVTNQIEQLIGNITFAGMNDDKEKLKRGITSQNIYNVFRDGMVHGNQGVVLKKALHSRFPDLTQYQQHDFFENEKFGDSDQVYIFKKDFLEKLKNYNLSPEQTSEWKALYNRSKLINSLNADLVTSFRLKDGGVLYAGTEFRKNLADEKTLIKGLQNVADDMMPRYFALYEMKGILMALREIYFKSKNSAHELRNTDHPHFKIAIKIYEKLATEKNSDPTTYDEKKLTVLNFDDLSGAILEYYHINRQADNPKARWGNLSSFPKTQDHKLNKELHDQQIKIDKEIRNQFALVARKVREDAERMDRVEEKNYATALLSRVIQIRIQNENKHYSFKANPNKKLEKEALEIVEAINKAESKAKLSGEVFMPTDFSNILIKYLDNLGYNHKDTLREARTLVEGIYNNFEAKKMEHSAKATKIILYQALQDKFEFVDKATIDGYNLNPEVKEKLAPITRYEFSDKEFKKLWPILSRPDREEDLMFYQISKNIHQRLSDKHDAAYMQRVREGKLSLEEKADLAIFIRKVVDKGDQFGFNSEAQFLENSSEAIIQTLKDLDTRQVKNMEDLDNLNYTCQFNGYDLKGSWNNQVDKLEPRNEADKNKEDLTVIIGKTWVGRWTGIYSPDVNKGRLAKFIPGQTMRMEAVIPGQRDVKQVLATESNRRMFFKFNRAWLPETVLYEGVNRPLMKSLHDIATVIDENHLLDDISPKTPKHKAALLLEEKLYTICKLLTEKKDETGTLYTAQVVGIVGEKDAPRILKRIGSEVSAGKWELGPDAEARINKLKIDKQLKEKLLNLADRSKRPYNDMSTNIALVAKVLRNASEALGSYVQEFDEAGNPIDGYIKNVWDLYGIDKDNIVVSGTDPMDPMTPENLYALNYNTEQQLPMSNVIVSSTGNQHTIVTLPYDNNIDDSFSASNKNFTSANRGAMGDKDKLPAGSEIGKSFSRGCHYMKRMMITNDMVHTIKYMETEEPELNWELTKGLVRGWAAYKELTQSEVSFARPKTWGTLPSAITAGVSAALNKDNRTRTFNPAEKEIANAMIVDLYRKKMGNWVLRYGMPMAITAILMSFGMASAIPLCLSVAFALKKGITRAIYLENGYGIAKTWKAGLKLLDPKFSDDHDAQEDFKNKRKVLGRNLLETASYITTGVVLGMIMPGLDNVFSISSLQDVSVNFVDPIASMLFSGTAAFAARAFAMNVAHRMFKGKDETFYNDYYDMTKKRSMAQSGQSERAFLSLVWEGEGVYQALEDSIQMQYEILSNKILIANKYIASYNPPETTPSGLLEMFNGRWIGLAVRYLHEKFMHEFMQKEDRAVMFQIVNMMNYPRMLAYVNYYIPYAMMARNIVGVSLIPFSNKLSFNWGDSLFDITPLAFFGALSVVRMGTMRYLHNATAINAGLPHKVADMQHSHQYANTKSLHEAMMLNSEIFGAKIGETFKPSALPIGYENNTSTQSKRHWMMFKNFKKQPGDTNDAYLLGWVRTMLQVNTIQEALILQQIGGTQAQFGPDLINTGVLACFLYDMNKYLDGADATSRSGGEGKIKLYGKEYMLNQNMYGVQGRTRHLTSIVPTLGILSLSACVGITLPLGALIGIGLGLSVTGEFFATWLKGRQLNEEFKKRIYLKAFNNIKKDGIKGFGKAIVAEGTQGILPVVLGSIPVVGPTLQTWTAPLAKSIFKWWFVQDASATTWRTYDYIPKLKTINAWIDYRRNNTKHFKAGPSEIVKSPFLPPKKTGGISFPIVAEIAQTDLLLNRVAKFMLIPSPKEKELSKASLSLKERAIVNFMNEMPSLLSDMNIPAVHDIIQGKLISEIARLKQLTLASEEEILKVVRLAFALKIGNIAGIDDELSKRMDLFDKLTHIEGKIRVSLISDEEALADYLIETEEYELARFFLERSIKLYQDSIKVHNTHVDVYGKLNDVAGMNWAKAQRTARDNDMKRSHSNKQLVTQD